MTAKALFVPFIFLFLCLGACRSMNDVVTDKASGVAKVYPVNADQAWDIARAVFRWEGCDAIEEHRSEGYMLTSSGMNLVTYGTLMAAWIDAEGSSSSRVTVVTKRRVATNLFTTLTEATFHRRFTGAVEIVQAGSPLPAKAPFKPD
jgi:hypothetical protein